MNEMHLNYSLESTSIEVTQSELDHYGAAINRARRSEEARGRTVTVLVRLEIHEASDKQIATAPLGRLFPRPLAHLGAAVPEVIADKLRAYAVERGQPLSDVARVLWTEFLIARDRGDRGDKWATFIEGQLNEIRSLREDKKRISYARTKQMQVRPKRSTKRSSRPSRTSKRSTR